MMTDGNRNLGFQNETLVKQLAVVAGMLLIMVVIGGVTRLTGSGLSIVEWRPVSGIIPPLTKMDWVDLFQAYQQTPEYLMINKGMDLAEFKSIFWLEFIHRFWGRLMGVMFLIPLIYSFSKDSLKPFRLPLIGILILGGAQGGLGWIMVKSGLVHDPHVSPYKLTAHLLLALITYSFILRLCIQVKGGTLIRPTKSFYAMIALVILTIIYGGLVAGFKAGLIYNDFPLMGGQLIPEDFGYLHPLWLNFIENPGTIQWIHRILALTTLVSLMGLSVKNRSYRPALMMGILQVFLGVVTLIYQVPIVVATLHQLGAFLLLTALILGIYKPKQWLVLPKTLLKKSLTQQVYSGT